VPIVPIGAESARWQAVAPAGSTIEWIVTHGNDSYLSFENDSHKIGSGGKLVKGVDGDGKMSLDEGNSR